MKKIGFFAHSLIGWALLAPLAHGVVAQTPTPLHLNQERPVFSSSPMSIMPFWLFAMGLGLWAKACVVLGSGLMRRSPLKRWEAPSYALAGAVFWAFAWLGRRAFWTH